MRRAWETFHITSVSDTRAWLTFRWIGLKFFRRFLNVSIQPRSQRQQRTCSPVCLSRQLEVFSLRFFPPDLPQEAFSVLLQILKPNSILFSCDESRKRGRRWRRYTRHNFTENRTDWNVFSNCLMKQVGIRNNDLKKNTKHNLNPHVFKFYGNYSTCKTH